MSLGDAYTLGVRLTGDITSLRQEIAAGKTLVNQFGAAAVESLNRAASAMETASAAMARSAARTGTAAQRQATTTTQSTRTAASSFEDYMRRATKAQEQVASTTESTTARSSTALGGLGRTLATVTGVAGFGLLAKQVWDTGIGFNEFTQNTQVALTTLLGSGAAAKAFLADILDFAKQTPYAFTDLTEQAQKLLSYGFDAKEIIPILTAVGDASTGMGKGTEGVERLSRALGQINAKGRLQSEELLQLNEIGVNGLKILANQAGMTTIEYQKLITAGLIPADQAVSGLVKGINEGTNGINGHTAAFGGLMEQIKGSGGITATVDSAKSAFRNAAAALTDSLVPAYTGFLKASTQGLGVVKDTANTFSALPGPVRSAALAFTAAAIAAKLLNAQGRASTVWSGFQGQIAASKATAQAMGREIGTLRATMLATRAAAPALGSALLGAFGGPVGLAVAGVTAAVAAFSTAQAEAKQRVQELSETLDEQGQITDETRQKVIDTLTEDTGAWYDRHSTAADAAQRLGLDLEVLTDAAMGSVDALKQVKGATPYIEGLYAGGQAERAKRLGLSNVEYARAVGVVREAVKGSNKNIDEAIRVAEQKAKADGKSTAALDDGTKAYERYTNAVQTWSEEQQKAIDAAGEAAKKASDVAFGTLDLNLSTEEEVADARDKVAEATRKVRDAEADREETFARKKVSANDKVKAEDAVAEARKALAEATESLGDTEARRDPVAQYKKTIDQMLADTQQFVSDVQALGDKGLNATDLQAIIAQGAEGSADTRKALLGDPSMIDYTNSARSTLDGLTEQLSTQARLITASTQGTGQVLMQDVMLGMRAEAQAGAYDTIEELATALGSDPQRLYTIGAQLGLSFAQGMADATKYQRQLNIYADGTVSAGNGAPRAYANGGIYPGYTPGRDIGYIGVSGGEAIMRPEWTRAVGAGTVDRWNQIARTAGVGGMREEMRRYLGGFAGGGTVPQVVTVPVSSTVERHTPWTIQKAYFTDPRAAQGWGDRARAQSRKIGGR